MKEETIKTLFKKSEILGSEELTNKIMLKIEMEKKTEKTIQLKLQKSILLQVSILIFLTGLVLYFGSFPSFILNYVNYQKTKIFLFVILLFIVLTALNKILRIHNSIKHSN
ncbi:hypothetical protein [Flavobacterium sp. J27]|uniref:hypothetical protein n=1 Tax=Flavobacterium sp. J27 TaxID=2060419 RepID=UPI001030281A|nr:hypothetical protein [Flavobacterium sp. J27]